MMSINRAFFWDSHSEIVNYPFKSNKYIQVFFFVFSVCSVYSVYSVYSGYSGYSINFCSLSVRPPVKEHIANNGIPQDRFDASMIFKASALWADAFNKSKCPSVRVSVRLFTFEVTFKRLFAPTSRSQMSKMFRDSESLGKNNGQKCSQIWTFLFGSGPLKQSKQFEFN